MLELLRQLGIDWKLLLSQAVNFILLLAILTFFIYRPLLRMMIERRKKIELGVRGGEEAELRIAQAEKIKEEKISKAEKQALSIIKSAEQSAGKVKEQMLAEAKEKSNAVISEAAEVSERRRVEDLRKVLAEAKSIVKEAIVRAVSLKPEQVDEKLIDGAIGKIKEEKAL